MSSSKEIFLGTAPDLPLKWKKKKKKKERVSPPEPLIWRINPLGIMISLKI